MIDSKGDFFPWGDVWLSREGLEGPCDHALVEIREDGESETRTVDPRTIVDPAERAKIWWRPMAWAREGAKARNVAGLPEAVFDGQDGYLFHRLHSACEQIFEGGSVLSNLGVQRSIRKLERCQNFCAEFGSEYRLLMVPEAMAVYADKVPGKPSPSAHQPITLIQDQADAALRAAIVYPLQDLIEGRAQYETFPPDDIHFTDYGAFLCYRALMKTLPCVPATKILALSDLVAQPSQGVGGFGRMRGRDPSPRVHLFPPPVSIKELVNDRRFAAGKIDVIETEFSDLPSLVLFRSSNATGMFPYLYHNFSRIVAVAGDQFVPDLIESERPDVVVTEIPGRYLVPHAAHPEHKPDDPTVIVQHKSFNDHTTFSLPLPRGGAAIVPPVEAPSPPAVEKLPLSQPQPLAQRRPFRRRMPAS